MSITRHREVKTDFKKYSQRYNFRMFHITLITMKGKIEFFEQNIKVKASMFL